MINDYSENSLVEQLAIELLRELDGRERTAAAEVRLMRVGCEEYWGEYAE